MEFLLIFRGGSRFCSFFVKFERIFPGISQNLNNCGRRDVKIFIFQKKPRNFAEIYLKVEEHEHGFNNQGDNLPDLVFFSSGEASPFKIEIRALSSDGEPWVLFSNGLSNTQIRYSVL